MDDKTTLKRDNKEWEFFRHCKCRHTGKVGLYNLSHTSSEHRFKQVTSDVSINVVDTPARDNTTIGIDTGEDDENKINSKKFKDNSNEDEDKVNILQFEGYWIAEVSNEDNINVATITTTFVVPQLPIIDWFYDACIRNIELSLANDKNCFGKLKKDTEDSDENNATYDNVCNQ